MFKNTLVAHDGPKPAEEPFPVVSMRAGSSDAQSERCENVRFYARKLTIDFSEALYDSIRQVH